MRTAASKRYTIRVIFGLILSAVFLLHTSELLPIPLLKKLENMAYDLRLNLTLPNTVDERIVIVDIDEKSLKAEGRWPWGRDRVAMLVDRLFNDYHVSLVAFDVLFAEPDNTSGLGILQDMADGPLRGDQRFLSEFQRIRPELDKDQKFADTIQNNPVILGYYFKNRSSHGDFDGVTGVLPDPVITLQGEEKKIPFITATGFGASLPVLAQSATDAGFIDMPISDTDGIIRRIPLVQRYGDHLYQSLSLAVLRTLAGQPSLSLQISPAYKNTKVNMGLEYLKTDSFTIPVDEQGNALVPFRGRFPSFNYVSAVDIISGIAPTKTLENTVAIVGTTAAGLLDLRSTPMQNFYPGVETHANMITGALDGIVKHRPGFVHGIEFLVILILGLAMSFIFPQLRLMVALIISLTMLVISITINFLAWSFSNVDLPIVSQVAMISSLFVFHLGYEFFVENRNKREITKLFGQYVPSTLVDEMSRNPQDFAIGGQTRQMSVMFTDIRHFTTISEQVEPTQLTTLINQYFTEMTKIIHAHRGTIDKYIGDCIMAFWGAPLADDNHARHALEAAMKMIEAQPILNARFRQNGWPELKMGIGINSGPMHVGNMGSEFRMAYTVLGDEVNLASRLEGLTKRYNVPIIVSETTAANIPDFRYRELDLVRVMGKNNPVRIFEPLGPAHAVSPKLRVELDIYEQALQHYRQQRFTEAKKLFTELITMTGGPILYQEYLGRIMRFLANPPGEEWDGVYKLKAK